MTAKLMKKLQNTSSLSDYKYLSGFKLGIYINKLSTFGFDINFNADFFKNNIPLEELIELKYHIDTYYDYSESHKEFIQNIITDKQTQNRNDKIDSITDVP